MFYNCEIIVLFLKKLELYTDILMEGIPQIKRDEQYPLLKVEGGAGDGEKHPQNSPTIITTGWSVSCMPKKSWCNRWPEYVSACWMTLILVAISFLVFYGLGMSAYRRQPIVLMRCNDTKQARNVYYHYIVPRGADVSFRTFSDYLTFMAMQYPSLHFHVYFLLDDSWQYQIEGTKHSKFFNRFVPQISRTLKILDQNNYKREIRDFQRIYQNVNVTVMNLSKYMAVTPLRYKWKTVPINYLPFYARIYEIWQNGGIGFDLVTFNNKFSKEKRIDCRVDAILKQHNDGIDIKKYTEVLDSFDKEEGNDFFSMFLNLINNIINETSIFLDTEYTTNIKMLENSPVIRTHRTKRESINEENIKRASNKSNITDKTDNNHTITNNITFLPVHEIITNIPKQTEVLNLNSTQDKILNNKINITTNVTEVSKKKKSGKVEETNELPQVLLFYDVSGYIDDKFDFASKNYPKPDHFNMLRSLMPSHKTTLHSNYVTITPDGNFVAVTAPYHPFLFKLFSAGCQRLNPTFAVKDLLWRQCSGFLLNDSYCVSIRVIYL